MKDEVRRLLKWGSWVVLVLGIFLAFQALGALKAWRTVSPAYNSISVNGKGEAVSVPDVAVFSFTVSADAKAVSDAQNSVTGKIDAILAELDTLDIEEKDIKTSDYSVWPKYKYEPVECSTGLCYPSRQIADGYTVSHSITVKVRKTDDAGKALSVVGTKGATNISGLNFTTDDPDMVMKEARDAAIEDAKEKAKELSKKLGVRLVRVVGYYDNNFGGYPMYGEGMGGDMMKSSVASAPTLPVGENKTTANVTVTYEIR